MVVDLCKCENVYLLLVYAERTICMRHKARAMCIVNICAAAIVEKWVGERWLLAPGAYTRTAPCGISSIGHSHFCAPRTRIHSDGTHLAASNVHVCVQQLLGLRVLFISAEAIENAVYFPFTSEFPTINWLLNRIHFFFQFGKKLLWRSGGGGRGGVGEW